MLDKANEFLEFVAENRNELRRAVMKNTVYDRELFDEVFSDTIIKVYDRILSGKEIDDFKNYFFISAKFNFINRKNKKRKNENKRICIEDISEIDFIEEPTELDFDDVGEPDIYSDMLDYLKLNFEEFEIDIFITYWKYKSTKRTSYKMIAEEFEIAPNECRDIVKKITNSVKNDFDKYIKDKT